MNARLLPVAIAALITIGACDSSDATSNSAATEPTAAAAETTATETTASEPTVAGTASPVAESTVADASATVTIERSRFDATELRVEVGTTVTFVNNDAFAHTITARDDSPIEFDSGEFGQGETFEFTFEEAGEFAYFCRIHPTMRAVVIVE